MFHVQVSHNSLLMSQVSDKRLFVFVYLFSEASSFLATESLLNLRVPGVMWWPMSFDQPFFSITRLRICTVESLNSEFSFAPSTLALKKRLVNQYEVATQIFFMFNPDPWGKIPNLTNIFQMG